MNWNIFESLNDWNIITLVTQTKTKSKNIQQEDEAFKTILRGTGTRLSEKILTTMYRSMRTNDESTDRYYVRQRTSESYTLQETKRWRVIHQQ